MLGKYSSIVISNLFLYFLVLVSSGSAAILSIPNTSVPVGTATVQIPINVDNGTGIAGQQFTVTFDPAVLQPTSAIKGTLDSGAEWYLIFNTNVSGQISLGAYSLNGTSEIIPISGGAGSLARISFNVLGGLGSSTNLTFTFSKIVDITASEISSATSPGTFTVVSATPNINQINPASGPVGTEVTIDGTDFGSTQGTSAVKFNGTSATTCNSWSDTQIKCLAPGSATTGPVTVTTTAGTSNGMIFTIVSDTTGPSLAITSHSNGQHVSTANITLSGTASDSGKGDNGIQQVTVRGNQANNDTATGDGTANWSKAVNLNPGANFITVIAYDDSANHNQTIQGITIYYDEPISTSPSLSIMSHVDGQHVINLTITLSGTATDSGRGNNGIQQVTINGTRANNDTVAGTGTAYWSKGLTLSAGLNTFTVTAYDNSPAHNSTTLTITIYYYNPISNIIRVSRNGQSNGVPQCYSTIQQGIDFASVPSLIEITQETYDEDVILDFDQVIILEGGWETNFGSCSSYTTINGSLTIKYGMVIIENIILK